MNHDQYQLDLAESMGSMLNENSVSSIDSNEASTSSIVATAIDDESCLVCGELARTGSYIKCCRRTLTIHYLCNEGGVSRYFRNKPNNLKCYVCRLNQ